ncbi:hypothetical protein CCGE525_33055 (plasmid) [Rhizobium jaguaris]|uniref:Uncharacterized protein n=1 Tax=Rhizobium jaguaris TaxID=1312183 RepID=A0A387FWJ6_9HYPH|nr:hypothetical protein CCGE525_33055 [Rhizobium jaguaris]
MHRIEPRKSALVAANLLIQVLWIKTHSGEHNFPKLKAAVTDMLAEGWRRYAWYVCTATSLRSFMAFEWP